MPKWVRQWRLRKKEQLRPLHEKKFLTVKMGLLRLQAVGVTVVEGLLVSGIRRRNGLRQMGAKRNQNQNQMELGFDDLEGRDGNQTGGRIRGNLVPSQSFGIELEVDSNFVVHRLIDCCIVGLFELMR